MKKQHMLIAAAAIALGMSTGMPAQADPPPWAPAHGHRAKQKEHKEREYRYVYYPAQQVYYAPEKNVWFWMNGGNWSVGVNLPSRIQVSTSVGGVPIVLEADRPYVQHVYVEEHYGRPWREKHKHKDNEHHKEKHKDKHHKHGD